MYKSVRWKRDWIYLLREIFYRESTRSVTFKRHEEILTSERVERERDVRIAETWPSTTLQDVRSEQYLWEHIARNQAHRYRARQCPKAICGLPVHFMHKRDVTWKHNCTLLIERLLISSKYHPAGILSARTREKFMSIILFVKFQLIYKIIFLTTRRWFICNK